MKLRAGRGFSLEELQVFPRNSPQPLAYPWIIAAGSIRWRVFNVQRLKAYKAKLVVFPRCARKYKAGDSAPKELATATQVQGAHMPIVHEKPTVELVKVTNEMKSFRAYDKLRVEWTNKENMGARLKKAAEAEKEEKK